MQASPWNTSLRITPRRCGLPAARVPPPAARKRAFSKPAWPASFLLCPAHTGAEYARVSSLHFPCRARAAPPAPEFPIRLTAIGAPVLAGVASIKGDRLYQEPSFRYLHFGPGSFPHGIRPLFPFRCPIKPAAAILGGSPIRMWMWPAHTSASMTLSLFQSHNVLTISLPFSPKNTFRLYFAANAILF